MKRLQFAQLRNKMKTTEIELDLIDYSKTQMRVAISPDHVTELAAILQDGGDLPPVQVVYDSTRYYLVDGTHRVLAHQQAGLGTIAAIVTKGLERDAILAACGVNADHGLKRTNADKRKAVETLLNDAEWSTMTDSAIAKACRVSDMTVRKVRSEFPKYETEQFPKYETEQPPMTRTGIDGKQYKATKAKSPPSEAEPESDKDAATIPDFQVWPPARSQGPSPVLDVLGRVVPERLIPSMETAAEISAARNLLTTLKKMVNKLREVPGGEYLPQPTALDEFDALLRCARFWTTCTECEGAGCNSCRFYGWLRHGHNLSERQSVALAEFTTNRGK